MKNKATPWNHRFGQLPTSPIRRLENLPVPGNVLMENIHYLNSAVQIHQARSTKQEAALQCHRLDMREAIIKSRYDVVHFNLKRRNNPDDPNEEIAFPTVYMTGLEYAIYTCDWKMAIIMFLNAADPSYNCFDGTILENSSTSSWKSISDVYFEETAQLRTHEAFVQDENTPIFSDRSRRRQRDVIERSGFDGLYRLPSSNLHKIDEVHASLWLMSFVYDFNAQQKLSIQAMIRLTRSNMFKIGCEYIWRHYFHNTIFTSLLCLNQSMKVVSDNSEKHLPSEIAMKIFEFVIDDIIADTIQEGLRYVSEYAVAEITKRQLS